MNSQISLMEDLPILYRLALSYAPASARAPTLALLALDTRLAAILRAAREPMLAQLRLTWWREQVRADPSTWPSGDPLLAVLRSWGERRGALADLAEGWEALTAPAPLSADAVSALARARGEAFAALAEVVGVPGDRDEAGRVGTNWALADLAGHLSNPEERGAALALLEARDGRRARLSRRMRPLVVLNGLAGAPANSPVVLLKALRLGILGR